MLKRALVVFGCVYAGLLLLTLLILLVVGSHQVKALRQANERRIEREKNSIREMLQKMEEKHAERIEEIRWIEERKVDTETLEKAKQVLDELAEDLHNSFDSCFSQTVAIGDTAAELRTLNQVRGYFETVLFNSDHIEQIVLTRVARIEPMQYESRVMVHSATPPGRSMEGESGDQMGVTSRQHGFMKPGYKSMSQIQSMSQVQLGWRTRVDYTVGDVAWEEDGGIVWVFTVDFDQKRLFERVAGKDVPVGEGFGIWGFSPDERHAYTGLPNGGIEAYELMTSSWGETVWTDTSGDRILFALDVGRLPGAEEESAVLQHPLRLRPGYALQAVADQYPLTNYPRSRTGVIALYLHADEIYNTAWREREIAKIEQEYQRRKADLEAKIQETMVPSDREGTAYRGRIGGGLLLFFAIAVVFFLWLILPAFVYADAHRLGLPAGLWAFLVFIASFVGLAVYLLVRPRSRVVCHECGGPIEADFAVCPACGAELKATCPSCGKTVTPEWRVCPYCRNQLS